MAEELPIEHNKSNCNTQRNMRLIPDNWEYRKRVSLLERCIFSGRCIRQVTIEDLINMWFLL